MCNLEACLVCFLDIWEMLIVDDFTLHKVNVALWFYTQTCLNENLCINRMCCMYLTKTKDLHFFDAYLSIKFY